MVRNLVIAGLVAASACGLVVGAAVPASATEAAAPAYSTNSDLGTLLDNPATKAVLDKYIHEMISNPQIEMARSMTLRQLQAYSGDTLKDEVLAKIDADLAAVPAPK
ncbi:hypothetical protein [Sphingomonas sp. LH128]|uniref:hypothetical protein n=1 Tax=Sphingomonas sp. LH128 TaxID=473781 RepID=UPI0002F85547|nr:hypothetical protein [Sphingomonas sp. LH128]